ncbi:hypothetical protein J2847_003332 [Azospirillum agricola]|uniref:DUF4384 domain-containing protein n=1 Tax=Azospirillum agricola TaxID=1720247 RepID=UPI001AE21219|nr:DUF4384 domain-containing protein [Azospirillum agricola]MBP2230029.1 hypothetical protein [Azospirillum agricola]
MPRSLRKLPFGLPAAAIAAMALATPALADILAPVEPPAPAQIQQPAAGQPVAGPAEPTAVTVQPGPEGEAAQAEAPADLGEFIAGLLRETVGSNAAVALVDLPPPTAPLPAGAAKNVALDPVKPMTTVTAAIGKRLVKPMLGDAYAPVEIAVARDGKTVAKESFEVVPASRDSARPKIAAFLAKHAAPPAQPSIGTAAQDGPQLKLWLQTEDGGPIRIGSKVAIHWQATRDGYVSVYHFGSSGAVERVFPVAAAPDNFVQTGRTYRFPATGHLTFKGPAGQESFRAIITSYPSNTPRAQPGGLQFKGDPLRIIPTHSPMLFANDDLTRFYALPPSQYGEVHVTYTLQGL